MWPTYTYSSKKTRVGLTFAHKLYKSTQRCRLWCTDMLRMSNMRRRLNAVNVQRCHLSVYARCNKWYIPSPTIWYLYSTPHMGQLGNASYLDQSSAAVVWTQHSWSRLVSFNAISCYFYQQGLLCQRLPSHSQPQNTGWLVLILPQRTKMRRNL